MNVFLTQNERALILGKLAPRILHNIDNFTGEAREDYVLQLLNLLGDTQLSALKFAMDMTPETNPPPVEVPPHPPVIDRDDIPTYSPGNTPDN